jgi:hypothetical protein
MAKHEKIIGSYPPMTCLIELTTAGVRLTDA